MTLSNEIGQNLIDEYIRGIVKINQDLKPEFDPWYILQNFPLAIKIIREITEKYDFSSITGICGLADSGIPLGLLLSQSLDLPIYFYKRNGWKIENHIAPYSIFPIPPHNSRVILVDSHIGAGYTSGTCYSLLSQRGIYTQAIVTPLSFFDILPQDTSKTERNVPYLTLGSAKDHVNVLLDVFQSSNLEDIIHSIRLRYENDAPSNGVHPEFHRPSKLYALKSIARSVARKKEEVKYIDEELAHILQTLYGSSEAEMWSLVTNTKVIKEINIKIKDKLSFQDYDLIVGTGALGTFSSLVFAWQNNYSGLILSTYKSTGWKNLQSSPTQRHCVICVGRLITGVFLRNTINKLNQYNINVDKIFVLRFAPELEDFPKNLLIFEELKKFGNKLYFLS